MTHTIQIENVGPIERLSIPLPEAGVVVLRGRNGSGKSHALSAAEGLVGGRGRLPCRDGARRAVVEGCGARLTIGRSSRRTGEAEVHTLEGKLDISQLVQPPVKDQEAADRTRVKALLHLSGVAGDAGLYHGILPEGVQLGELIDLEARGDDPVTLAGNVKRALEAEARRHERAAEEARLKAEAARERAGNVDADAPSLAEAEAELQAALIEESRLKARAEAAAAHRAKVKAAREALAELKAVDAETPDALKQRLGAARAKIDEMERELAVAKERAKALGDALADAERREAETARLEAVLNADPEAVDDAALDAIDERVDRARRVHEEAVATAGARRMLDQAEGFAADAQAAGRLAGAYRDSAAAVDTVLTEQVSRVTGRLRVEAGRLVCETDRGAEPFAELSPGERWRLALEIAAEHVGAGGLITVPQEAWEGLDPQHRAEVAGIARRVGVVLLTAECGENASIAAEVV